MEKLTRTFLAAACIALTWSACSGESTNRGTGSASVAALTTSEVDRVEVTIDGTGFAETLLRDLSDNFPPALISGIPAGSYTFRAQAFDDDVAPPALLYEGTENATIVDGLETAVTILLQQVPDADEFGNTVPIFQSLVYTPANPNPGDTVTLTVNVTDPDVVDGDVVSLLWSELPGGGTLIPPLDQASVDWTAPATPGSYPITVTATDLSTATSTLTVSIPVALAPGSAEVTIELNTSPVVVNLVPNPTRIEVDESTALDLATSDPDGDPLSYAWSADCTGTFYNGDPDAGGVADSTVEDPHFELDADNADAPCSLTVLIDDGRGASNTATVTLATGPAVDATPGGSGLIACTIDDLIGTTANCPAGTSCYPSASGDFCGPEGTLGEDQPCTTVNDCVSGLGCVGVPTDPDPSARYCKPLCDDSAGLTCADGDPCDPLPGNSNLGACITETCDLFAQDCSVGSCYPNGPLDVCWVEGSGVQGDPCISFFDCAQGFTCIDLGGGNGQCLELCQTFADCGALLTCSDLTPPTRFGICVGP